MLWLLARHGVAKLEPAPSRRHPDALGRERYPPIGDSVAIRYCGAACAADAERSAVAPADDCLSARPD